MELNKSKKAHGLFLVGYSIYLVYQIISYSFFSIYLSNTFSRIVLLFSIVCCLIHELENGRIIKGQLIIFGLVCVLALISIKLNFTNFAFMIFILYFGRNVDFNIICKITTIVTLITVVFVIICAQAGLIINYVGYRGDGTSRDYWGFRYVLFAPGFLLNAMTAYLYVKGNATKRTRYLLLLIISYYIYTKTAARLVFILSIVLLVGAYSFNYSKTNKNVYLYRSLIPVYPLFALLSFTLTKLYKPGNSFWDTADKILSKRLQYSQRSLDIYGVELFGNSSIDWSGFSFSTDGTSPIFDTNMIYVDNAYLHILQRYGLLFSIIILSAFTFAMYIIYKRKNYYLELMFLIVAIHALIDNEVIYLCFNVFLFPLISIYVDYYNEKISKKARLYKSKHQC